jgi:hypothetical protein
MQLLLCAEWRPVVCVKQEIRAKQKVSTYCRQLSDKPSTSMRRTHRSHSAEPTCMEQMCASDVTLKCKKKKNCSLSFDSRLHSESEVIRIPIIEAFYKCCSRVHARRFPLTFIIPTEVIISDDVNTERWHFWLQDCRMIYHSIHAIWLTAWPFRHFMRQCALGKSACR